MGKRSVIAMWDNAANCFGQPGFYATSGVALRSFTDEVNRVSDDNPLYKHPVDFSLYLLGYFDDVTGEFEQEKTKLVDAVSVRTDKV